MHDSIIETIGSPLVQVSSPAGSTVAAKVESRNPGGSSKDRPAREMVRAAEKTGELRPGDRIVEPTSGNTGIGLAMVCAALGYGLTIVMPRSKSAERRRLMRAYGADLELVEGDMETARERAGAIADEEGAVLLGQFRNAANPRAHYRTTGEEIVEAVGDREVDAFVVAVGTGGTLSGTATRLLEEYPDLEVVAVEPARNPVLATGEAGHDEFQGMGPGFVSDNLDTDLIDRVETVPLEDAERECRRLAREEGILVGQSSGAAAIAARRVAGDLARPELECPPAPGELGPDPDWSDLGAVETDGGTEYDDCPLVVTVFPDSGERYLTTGTFDVED